MFTAAVWPWLGFTLLVLGLLVLDLGVFQRKAHAVSIKEASIWSAVWITLALAFNAGLYFFRGPTIALQFLTGYLLEKSLSVDNIFIFVLIFTSFRIPLLYQHRVLFWGIIGALVMRAALILAGAALLSAFHWVFYIFGAFLVITGIRMAIQKEKEIRPEKHPLVRLIQRFLPVAHDYEGGHFFTRRAGGLMVTPLLLTLVVVEVTDLIFALDSIPAIFSITQDPFIVYTSNVFAILGLRSLYFVLAGVVQKFHYLKIGLAVILVYVGCKMSLMDWVHIPIWISLCVIAFVLCVAIVFSLLRARKLARKEAEMVKP
jgi:tellurite resistance protein TerC